MSPARSVRLTCCSVTASALLNDGAGFFQAKTPQFATAVGLDAFMSEAAIRLHVEPMEEGGYVATSPDVPGLVVEGRSLVEVAEIARCGA